MHERDLPTILQVVRQIREHQLSRVQQSLDEIFIICREILVKITEDRDSMTGEEVTAATVRLQDMAGRLNEIATSPSGIKTTDKPPIH